VLVPVMYSLVDDFAAFFKRYYVRHDDDVIEVASATSASASGPAADERDGEVEPWEAEPEPVGARRSSERARRPIGRPGFDPAPEAG
jgi:hypothetical protein